MTDSVSEASTPDLSEFDALYLHQGDKCWYSIKARVRLSPEDLAKLDAALARSQDEYSNVVISKWLKAHDLKVSDTSVRRHRAGGCKCGSDE